MGMGWGREEIYLFGVLNIRLRGFEGFSECLPFYCFDVDFRRRTELMYSLNVPYLRRGGSRDHVLASELTRGLIKFSVSDCRRIRNFIQ